MSFSTCSCVLWQNEQRSGSSVLSFLTGLSASDGLPWWDKNTVTILWTFFAFARTPSAISVLTLGTTQRCL